MAAAFAYMVVFVVYPMARAIWMSFTNASLLTSRSKFVGVTNYVSLFSTGAFGQSLYITLCYVLVVSSVAMLAGLGIALLVNTVGRGRGLIRTLMVLPWAVPTLVVGLLFAVVFDPGIGVLDYLLHLVGVSPIGWVTNNTLAFWSVSFVTAWTVFPFVMLVSLAALQTVPSELYDESSVDGASAWQTTRLVVLPTIAPVLRIVGLFVVIWAFQLFQVTWVLTEGGPINGTNFIIIDLYKTAFVNQQLGLAASIGVIGLAFSVCATIGFLVLDRRAARTN